MPAAAPRSARRTAVALLLTLSAVLLLPACRSDGGLGRQATSQSMEWTYERAEQRFERNTDDTADAITGIPESIESSWNKGKRDLQATYNMYLEGHPTLPDRTRSESNEKNPSREGR